MSGGPDVVLPTGAVVFRSLELLAPLFREAVNAALGACHAAGIDAMVYETYRTNELQRMYYAKGRTTPGPIVTRAADNRHSWHGFGLAADVIDAKKQWSQPLSWWQEMGAIFKAHGCAWGGDWHDRDLPHVQWGLMPPSPTDEDRLLMATEGPPAVWQRWGAI